ncbi:MAG TPA: hypothetical protein VM347_38695 [Nonomuraea sp.]|nr:hypothetical protein [Nonomuraea sp.]
MFCPAHRSGSGAGEPLGGAPQPADRVAEASRAVGLAAPLPGMPPTQVVAPALEANWAADPRLEPLPMSLRPGWTEEPLERRRSGDIDILGVVALIVAVLGLPFSACCGFGGIVSGPLGLVSLGLGLAALLQAPKANNPTAVRWLSGFAVGVSLLILALTLCFVAVMFGGMGGSLFSMWTP